MVFEKNNYNMDSRDATIASEGVLTAYILSYRVSIVIT